tara:strand:- start:5828 stop:6322 length:495 start_codon:yes stop_codon:yes gene_type:complete
MKKGQIKMSETIGVLIIFFFLMVFGFGFYVRVQKINLEKDVERNADLRGISISQKAAFLPELQCTFNNIQTDNCFDRLKVEAFIEAILDPSTKDYYSDFFGFSEIRLEQFEIEGHDAINFTLYENPKLTSVYISTISVPVSIYFEETPGVRKYSFAILNVRSYG